MMPLENAFSRWREHMADDTRYRHGESDAFASAMTRLANQNLGKWESGEWVVFCFIRIRPWRTDDMAKNWK